MTVGLVVVSHSRALARAAVALAQEMLHGKQIRIAIAAGLDDTTFGTDAAQIVDAIVAADQGAGVVVLMDLGSAVLSAELALELLDDDVRERVVLCPAPLVEGLVVAAVAAANGAASDEVAAEASGALAGKIGHLGSAPRSRGRRRMATPTSSPAASSSRIRTDCMPAPPRGWCRRSAVATPMRGSATAAPSRNGLTPGAFRRSQRWVCGPVTRSRCGCRAAGRRNARPHSVAGGAKLRRVTGRGGARAEPAVRQAPIAAGPGLGIGPARSSAIGRHHHPRRPGRRARGRVAPARQGDRVGPAHDQPAAHPHRPRGR